MSGDELQTLANAFHAAAEEYRAPPTVHPMLANLKPRELDPGEAVSRSIAADVLKAIGDVYSGQAAQYQ